MSRERQSRVLAILTKDPSSVPNIPVECLRTVCNSSSRGHNALFWSPQALTFMSTYPHTNTHINVSLIIRF